MMDLPIKPSTTLQEEKMIIIGKELTVHEEQTAGTAANTDDSKTPGAVAVMNQTRIENGVLLPILANSLKRACPTGFHYAANWFTQRPHKILRTQQANVVSSITCNYESPMPSRGFTSSEPGSSSSFNPLYVSPFITSLDNNYPTTKIIFGNASCPTDFSGPSESEGGENKLKQEIANAVGVSIDADHKAEAFKRDSSDDMQGKERISMLADVSHIVTETESVPLRKTTQDMRYSLTKDTSKTGHAPPKKHRNCKASVFTGHHLNDKPSDNTGECDVDNKDLLVAASSVHNAREHACSHPFWKKMESLFAPVTAEDLLFLKRQLNSIKELNQTGPQMFTDVCEAVGVTTKSPRREISNLDEGSVKFTDFGRPKAVETLGVVPPLFQRVLSALIDEDEHKESHNPNERKSEFFQCVNNDSRLASCSVIDSDPKNKDRVETEVESEVDLESQNHFHLDGLSGSCSASSSKKSVSSTFGNEEQRQTDDSNTEIFLGSDQNDQNVVHSSQVNAPLLSPLDKQYQVVSLDGKLSLELQSIGLNPEVEPLVEGGEEWIDKEILPRKLYQQVAKVKNHLRKIKIAIQREQELKKRSIEESAMDQLVEMAYKRMVGRPTKSSRIRKVSKQVALAFVNRILARCKQFEDTGRSCFSQPNLQDILFCEPPSEMDVDPTNSDGVMTSKEDRNNSKNYHSGGHMFNKDREELLLSQSGGSSSSKAKEVRITHPGESFSGAEHPLSHPPGSITSHDLTLTKGKMKSLNEIASCASSKANLTSQRGGVQSERVMKDGNQNGDGVTESSTSGSVNKSKAKSKKKRPLSRIGIRESVNSTQLSTVKSSDPTTSNANNEESQSPATKSSGAQIDELDLTKFDFLKFLGLHEDLSSQLNFDDEGLSDNDCAGLDVPMDDLADIDMFV